MQLERARRVALSFKTYDTRTPPRKTDDLLERPERPHRRTATPGVAERRAYHSTPRIRTAKATAPDYHHSQRTAAPYQPCYGTDMERLGSTRGTSRTPPRYASKDQGGGTDGRHRIGNFGPPPSRGCYPCHRIDQESARNGTHRSEKRNDVPFKLGTTLRRTICLKRN